MPILAISYTFISNKVWRSQLTLLTFRFCQLIPSGREFKQYESLWEGCKNTYSTVAEDGHSTQNKPNHMFFRWFFRNRCFEHAKAVNYLLDQWSSTAGQRSAEMFCRSTKNIGGIVFTCVYAKPTFVRAMI